MTVSVPQMIKKRLSEEGITKVAIIDDDYDLPTVDSFNANEIEEFWTTIERDEEMTAWGAPIFSTTYNERVPAFTLDCPASSACLFL